MNIVFKLLSVLLIVSCLPFSFVMKSSGETNNKPQCPNPFPNNYRSSLKSKNVKIPNLGIMVRVSNDQRLVDIKSENRLTFMTSPEYKSYQCSLSKGIDYTKFYPYPYSLSYTVIANPTRKSLSKVIEETYGGDINIFTLETLKINGIEFLTTSKDQSDSIRAWFIPKNKSDIVIQYSSFCDCGRDYKDVVNELRNIRNVSR